MNLIPTVGRIVYFKGQKDGEIKNYPAMVTDVVSTEATEATAEQEAVAASLRLLLNVFSEAGVQTLWVDTQGEVAGGWDWMPFQKDQQARLADESAKTTA